MRVALVLAVVASCKCSSDPLEARRDAGLASRKDAGAAALPFLPGTLWFVDDGPPRTLSRIARGVRTEVTTTGADLFPSRWSLPDGRLVAIASRGDGSADSEQLALISRNGKVTRIGPTAAMVRDPAVDPRGRWIVVAANVDGHSDLYRIDLDTEKSTRITNDPKGNFAPAFLSADAIVFASSRDDNSEIYRMVAAGGKAQRLTAFHKDDWAPVVSPDGATIAFASDREGPARIFMMAPDGTQQRRLTTRGPDDGDELELTWSRDGTRIAYIVERGKERSLYLRDATGRERALTPTESRDAEPSFSPDGKWIAVSRTSINGTTALWVIDNHGDQTQVTRTGSPRLPRWH